MPHILPCFFRFFHKLFNGCYVLPSRQTVSDFHPAERAFRQGYPVQRKFLGTAKQSSRIIVSRYFRSCITACQARSPARNAAKIVSSCHSADHIAVPHADGHSANTARIPAACPVRLSLYLSMYGASADVIGNPRNTAHRTIRFHRTRKAAVLHGRSRPCNTACRIKSDNLPRYMAVFNH